PPLHLRALRADLRPRPARRPAAGRAGGRADGLPRLPPPDRVLRAVPVLREARPRSGRPFGRAHTGPTLTPTTTDRRPTMGKPLKGTRSRGNLKDAFAGESQANRRYLYFARVADIEGYPDMGGLFRDTAEAETGHAFGHLDFLKEVGDPVTDVP